MDCKRLAVATLAAASGFFSAQSLAQPYVGFSAGQADVEESMVIPGLIDPGGRVDGKDGAFKLFGGYQFNPNFALEAAFVDLGDVSYSGSFTGNLGAVPVSGGRIQNSGINLSAVGVVPLGQRFVFFGKVGMFLWYSEASDVTGGFAFYSEEDGADLSVGLGASVALGQRVSLRAEWERFDMSNTDVDLVTVGFAFRF
ncbi:MAG TPA: outer membrane beta-barrel protein [Burkholderiales bacterium]